LAGDEDAERRVEFVEGGSEIADGHVGAVGGGGSADREATGGLLMTPPSARNPRSSAKSIAIRRRHYIKCHYPYCRHAPWSLRSCRHVRTAEPSRRSTADGNTPWQAFSFVRLVWRGDPSVARGAGRDTGGVRATVGREAARRPSVVGDH
jgi:hypothetical protein